MTLDEKIRAVLAQHGKLAVDPQSLGDDDDLYRSGLSSHATVSVMLALEEEFDVEFPDRLLCRGTFATITAIRQALLLVSRPGEP